MRKVNLLILSSAIAALYGAHSAAAQPFDWTGAYVGVNAGGVVDGETRFDRTVGFLPNNTDAVTTGLRPRDLSISDNGFTGGAQVGYNFGLGDAMGGNLVLGVEADIAYTDLDQTEIRSNTTFIGPLGTPSTVPVTRINEYNSELNYLGTVRGRVGFAFDRLLVYGTGGLAFGGVKNEIIFYGPNANTTPFFTGTDDETKTGWVYGAGVEFAAPTDSMFNVFNSSAVTVKAEYLHYDLGEDTLTYPGVNGGSTIGGYTSRVRTDGDIVRAGLNFRF